MIDFGTRRIVTLAALALVPILAMGADGERASGCDTLKDDPTIPDTTGTWDIQYDDTLTVELAIGGATYVSTVGAGGGVIVFDDVNGQPLTFDLDCAREDVLCPTEVWPQTVTISQEPDGFDALVKVDLPSQTCDGEMVEAPADRCGEGTHNPACEDVCDGEMVTVVAETLGVVNSTGPKISVFLGAGAASNGINCALLGLSVAEASISTTGSAGHDTLTATSFDNGEVKTGYAGGCLWADDLDDDGELEALVLGASIVFKTGFTGTRAD